ncbi:MAG: hypothetical protein MN733_31295 [Nitrososphaera sp.]|nr:hypothetical protein [Nitrososphaera sp.]
MIKIKNSGKGEITDIFGQIVIEKGEIETPTTQAPPGVEVEEETTSNKYTIHAEPLNENEEITVAAMISAPDHEIEPQIYVRGKGLLGELIEESRNKTPTSIELYIQVLLASFTGVLLVATMIRVVPLRTRSGNIELDFFDRWLSDDERKYRVAYILDRCGLPNEANKFRFAERDIPYSAAADYLLNIGRHADNIEKFILALKCLLLIEHMHDIPRNLVMRAIKTLDENSYNKDVLVELQKRGKKVKDEVELRVEIDKLVEEDSNNQTFECSPQP